MSRTSTGTTVVQSDTDMIYKEHFTRVSEIEEKCVQPRLREVADEST